MVQEQNTDYELEAGHELFWTAFLLNTAEVEIKHDSGLEIMKNAIQDFQDARVLYNNGVEHNSLEDFKKSRDHAILASKHVKEAVRDSAEVFRKAAEEQELKD